MWNPNISPTSKDGNASVRPDKHQRIKAASPLTDLIAPSKKPSLGEINKLNHESGFSLFEVSVAVGLTGVIVLGLAGALYSAQKALSMSRSQSDVLPRQAEIINTMVRSLEQLDPESDTPEHCTSGPLFVSDDVSAPSPTGEYDRRFSCVYFQRRVNDKRWAEGYWVDCDPNGVGTLYFFRSTTIGPINQNRRILHAGPGGANLGVPMDGVVGSSTKTVPHAGNLHGLYTNEFLNAKPGDAHLRPIMDGVVSFSAKAFPHQRTSESYADASRAGFTNGALPSTIKISLAVLPSDVLKVYGNLSTANLTNANEYLKNNLGKAVVMERMARIPVVGVSYPSLPDPRHPKRPGSSSGLYYGSLK